MATRIARVNSDAPLQLKLYSNGVLFTPYSIDPVRILDAPTGGTVLATIIPTLISTGIYEAIWSIGSIQAGLYYDEWTWTAQNGMAAKTQTYEIRVDAHSNRAKAGVSRTGPLFVGSRELNFFHGVNKELLQKIIRQKIIYYSVSEEHTNSHRLYDEAIRKTVFTPMEVNALVLYKDPEQTVDKFSIDTTYSIEVYFYQEELKERELIPREGDFLRFGDVSYEIEKLNRPQIVYGQIGNEVMVKATCRVARASQFDVLDDYQGK